MRLWELWLGSAILDDSNDLYRVAIDGFCSPYTVPIAVRGMCVCVLCRPVTTRLHSMHHDLVLSANAAGTYGDPHSS